MIITTSCSRPMLATIRNNVIDEVKSTKFLGIVLDDKLKWTDCRFGALPTELQRETSFHRLCVAFVESVSLQLHPAIVTLA